MHPFANPTLVWATLRTITQQLMQLCFRRYTAWSHVTVYTTRTCVFGYSNMYNMGVLTLVSIYLLFICIVFIHILNFPFFISFQVSCLFWFIWVILLCFVIFIDVFQPILTPKASPNWRLRKHFDHASIFDALGAL